MNSAALIVSKGHGTGNDFVIVDDLDAPAGTSIELTPELVRSLCDRRTGIGGDGVLRAIRTAGSSDFAAVAPGTTYFMDYRNADGSLAEMCGNGLRVFVRYLADTGRLDGDAPVIGTRAGALRTRIEADAQITVDLGPPQLGPEQPQVRAEPMAAAVTGTTVRLPNPHVVVRMTGADALASLVLDHPPTVTEPLPQGQNVEFVVHVGDHHLAMRVHERGAGETRSCGTGIGAVVAALSAPEDRVTWRVDVPGGTCTVRRDDDGHLWLTGPAVIVGRVELTDEWLDRATPAAISS